MGQDGCKDRKICTWIDRYGWIDGWVDEWVGKRMDGWIDTQIHR